MNSTRISNRVAYAIWIVFAIVLVGGMWMSGFQYEGQREALEATCQASLKHLTIAMAVYLDDSQGNFPRPERWNDALVSRYAGSKWSDWCPAAYTRLPTYAMNAKLKGLTIRDVKHPDKTVLLFESISGKNLSGGAELFAKPARHPNGYSVAFVSGRVMMVRSQAVDSLIWDPQK